MRKYIYVFMCLSLLTLLVGCKRDTTPPEVVSTAPAYGEQDVEIVSAIAITFTEPMNKSSVETSFKLAPQTAGTYSWQGNTVTFTPTQALLPSTEYEVSFAKPVTDVAGNALAGFTIRFLTHSPVASVYTIRSHRWLPDSKTLLMSANIGDYFQLYSVSADGKSQAALNPQEQHQLDPDVANTGMSVAYVGGSDSELFIYNMQTKGLVTLSLELHGDMAAHPLYSPDGTKIALLSVLGYADAHSDIYQSVWVYDKPTGTSKMYTPSGDTDWLLGFSADSKSIYVLSTYELYNHSRDFRYDLWSIDLASGGQTKLSSAGPIHNYVSGDIHPTGVSFVYGEWEPIDVDSNIIAAPTDIYVVDMNPFKLTKITSTGRNAYPAYSPDGSRIVYTVENTSTSWEVYTMDRDGKNVVQLTNSGGPKLYPQWSPDGMQISFVQIEGEGNVLYVMNADGTNLRRVTH